MVNEALISLFKNHRLVDSIREGLPRAFEVADAESRRVQQKQGGKTYEAVGQEVGVVRERILVAFLRHALGDISIELPSANLSMRDVLVSGKPLEIKTVTANGELTAKWTADTQSVNRDISAFQFTADLLLVRIWWGEERDSLFYIPLEVLQEIADGRKAAEYLSSAQGTNNRGIKIKNWFINQARDNCQTVRIPINWQRGNLTLDPMARWMAYWANRSDRDPLYR